MICKPNEKDIRLSDSKRKPRLRSRPKFVYDQTQSKRTPVCSQTEITGPGRKFERTKVWTMVWRWSDQRSVWSEKSDHSGFEPTWV